MSKKIKIMTVCHGNICRSAMAKVILDKAVLDLGLADKIEVDSSGISSEERGNPMDYRAVETLKKHGFNISDANISKHRAKKISMNDIEQSNLLLPMTFHQYYELKSRFSVDLDKLFMWRFFDEWDLQEDCLGDHIADDLEDPWYGGMSDFEVAYKQLINNTQKIVKFAMSLQ